MAPLSHNEAHNALVRDALQELALAGFCAWPSGTGAYKTEHGTFIKYGKKGGGDITGILPRRIIFSNGMEQLIGQHFEAEVKTGTGRQNKNQKGHQQFVVERNGGIYILFRSTEELLNRLKAIA